MNKHFTIMLLFFFCSLLLSCSSGEDVSINKKQQVIALKEIKKSYGNKEQEYGVNLFVSHHLKELSQEYWESITGKTTPSAKQVLNALTFKSRWLGNDEINYDFTLPNNVTQYVICVKFDSAGNIIEITMES